jgi:hypothetical protein
MLWRGNRPFRSRKFAKTARERISIEGGGYEAIISRARPSTSRSRKARSASSAQRGICLGRRSLPPA